MMTAIMQTPTAQIPLNIPFPPQVIPTVTAIPAVSAMPTVPAINVPIVSAVPNLPTVPIPAAVNLVQPPPLPQLPSFIPSIPSENTTYLPLKIKARIDEMQLSEAMFRELLKIYENVREEYIELLKRGFLIFFPYLLGTRWRER